MKILALILAFCLCAGMVACGTSSDSNTTEASETIVTEPKVILTKGQENAVKPVFGFAAILDYNCRFEDITYETLEDDGTYITVTGVVTFVDQAGKKYYGDFTNVIVGDKETDTYELKSWDLGELRDADGETIDFYSKLCDYVVKKGSYDSSGKQSYISGSGNAANNTFFLIAKNNELRFLSSTKYESSSRYFVLNFELVLPKGKTPRFELVYILHTEFYQGVAVGGEQAEVKGTIDNSGNIKISSEEYYGIEKNAMLDQIRDDYSSAVEFIEGIMEDASIGVSFESLIS